MGVRCRRGHGSENNFRLGIKLCVGCASLIIPAALSTLHASWRAVKRTTWRENDEGGREIFDVLMAHRIAQIR